MKAYKAIALLLCAAALAAGCSDRLQGDSLRGTEITVAPTVDEFGGTKAQFVSTLNTANNSIQVVCYRAASTTKWFECTAVYAPYNDMADRWVFFNENMYDYKYYWPDASGKLDFFAYYPVSLTNTCVTLDTYVASTPKFHCTSLPVTFPSTENTNLEEFIYAFEAGESQPSSSDKHNTVGLTFHHPFARITIQLETAIRSTLNSVTITNIYNNGNCTVSSTAPKTSWTSTGSTTNLVVTSGLDYPEEINNGATIGGPYIVLPQSLTDNVELKVNYLATGNSNPTVVGVKLKNKGGITEWKPGYAYTYKLSLNGAANEAIVDVSVTPWSVQGESETEVK